MRLGGPKNWKSPFLLRENPDRYESEPVVGSFLSAHGYEAAPWSSVQSVPVTLKLWRMPTLTILSFSHTIWISKGFSPRKEATARVSRNSDTSSATFLDSPGKLSG